MTDVQKAAVAQLREQQREFPEASTQFHAAEQLIEICEREPESARLILEDLKNPDMSVERAERKIHDAADELHQKWKHGVAISDRVAERILRDFYGIPQKCAATELLIHGDSGNIHLDLWNFL